MKTLRKDKIVSKGHGLLKSTLLEKEILQTVVHPFLASLDFVFQTEVKLFFIMGFIRGGDFLSVLKKVKKFAEADAKFYVAQIAIALGALHDN